MLAGGLAGLSLAPATEFRVGPAIAIPANRLLGIVLFFLAAVTALCGLAFLQAGCRRLTRQLEAMQDQPGSSTRLASPHPDLAALVGAFNNTAELVEQSIARAELRVKELEIQLKV